MTNENKKTMQQKVKVISKEEIDPFVRKHLQKELEDFLELYRQKFSEESLKEFKITIKGMHKKGRKEEFEVHGNLFTDFGDFHAKRIDWSLEKIFSELIEAIKKQIRM